MKVAWRRGFLFTSHSHSWTKHGRKTHMLSIRCSVSVRGYSRMRMILLRAFDSFVTWDSRNKIPDIPHATGFGLNIRSFTGSREVIKPTQLRAQKGTTRHRSSSTSLPSIFYFYISQFFAPLFFSSIYIPLLCEPRNCSCGLKKYP